MTSENDEKMKELKIELIKQNSKRNKIKKEIARLLTSKESKSTKSEGVKTKITKN